MRIVRPIVIDDAVLVSTTATEDTADWSGGDTYALDEVVAHADHTWRSLAGANSGHVPGADGSEDFWLDRGADNIWAMFDRAVQSQTVDDDELEVVFAPPSLIDTVALLNVNAAEVQVTITDDVEGVVYDTGPVSLISDGGITDWYAYFFQPIERDSEKVFDALPPYIGAEVTVTLRDPGLEPACGACIAGLSLDLGGTQWSPEVGIDDYSVKRTDDFGNITVVERSYNRRGRFQVWVERGRVSYIQNVLAAYRATPLLFIGSPDDPATLIYGFYSSFSQVIAYPDVAVLDVDVKGLV